MYLENNQVKRYPVRIILSWTAVVIWMAVIFAFSHQTADQSGKLSLTLAENLVRLFDSEASLATVLHVEGILRNIAHGGVFFVLGLLTCWAFSETGPSELRNALLTFILCALYAASDELHQAFIPGRAGQWYDYLIDLAGILLAIALYQLVTTLRYLREDLRVKREEDLRI
jgi:VanZ family protein